MYAWGKGRGGGEDATGCPLHEIMRHRHQPYIRLELISIPVAGGAGLSVCLC